MATPTTKDDEVVLHLPPVPVYSEGVALRSILEIQTDLKKPIPDKFLEKRVGPGGGKPLTYWPWQVGVRAFDRYAPGWGLEFSPPVIVEGHVSIVAKLFIPCLEAPYPGYFRSSTGGDYENSDEAKRSKGFDPVLDAERQAMKRAMSNWGFGFYLYG